MNYNMEPWSLFNLAKNCGLMSDPDKNPAKTEQVMLLGGS
jgi:hypothetical protein